MSTLPSQEPTELDPVVLIQQHGPKLVQRLGQVVRTARLHDLQNHAFTGILTAAIEASSNLTAQLGEVLLLVQDQTAHINDTRVRLSRNGMEHLAVVSSYLRARGIGGLVLQGESDDAQWRTTMQTLKDAEEIPEDQQASDANSLRLNELLEQEGVRGLGFAPPWQLKLAHLGAEAGEAESLEVTTGRELYIYIRALRAIQALQLRVRHGRHQLGLVRIAQQLIELDGDHPRYWQKLLLLKDTASYELRHPVHSTILAIALGRRLGLSRTALLDLAQACLVADIGLALVPAQILEQPELSGEDKVLYEHHPADSARVALGASKLDTSGIRQARVAWEHERRFDGQGYPQPLQPGQQHLFTRIYAVAETFDRLTSHGPTRRGMYPEQALAKMLEMRGAELDPTLVLHFINMTGRLPLNTPVQLDNGEMGRVFAPPGDPLQVRRPKVRVFYGADRQKLEPPIDRDLLTRDPSGYRWSIAKVLPRKLKA
ncbi:MAG: HD domain-containing phosphohydrolase [Myxococcota bacterium]|nr:HD domain-containing phosphohydrolase [Myxococcota bacterium]